MSYVAPSPANATSLISLFIPSFRSALYAASTPAMVGALERLKASAGQPHLPAQLGAFGVSGGTRSGLARLFMSHPPLDERIAALKSRAA